MKLKQWNDISSKYQDGLLLGNGASRAIDSNFSYQSLLRTAKDKGLIDSQIQKIFDHLSTEDFELVLNMLWHTFHINSALGLPSEITKQAYIRIREALVQTVRANHASHDSVQYHFDKMIAFMGRFKLVASLNYDLSVYWAMLEANSKIKHRFKDCFIHSVFDHDWQGYKIPYGGADAATLVFYPHGNLSIATSLLGCEEKIEAVKTNGCEKSLLDKVVEEWQSGNKIPLFVSEGNSKQKKTAIQRSAYLSSVYDTVLPHLGESLAIYGWSFGDNDAHILSKICQKKNIDPKDKNANKKDLKNISISIYKGGRSAEEIRSEMLLIESKISAVNDDVLIEFFDAESADCWIH